VEKSQDRIKNCGSVTLFQSDLLPAMAEETVILCLIELDELRKMPFKLYPHLLHLWGYGLLNFRSSRPLSFGFHDLNLYAMNFSTRKI